jgi:rubrerythrin
MSAIPSNYVGLSRYLQHHIDAEQGALDAYGKLVADRDDDMVSYLIHTILSDEARHHELFREILNSLESKIRWDDVEPLLPPVPRVVENREALLATTDRLIELEEDDLKDLKRLRKSWTKAKGDLAVWAVLIESAEFDTQKHIMILKHLRRLIGKTEGAD